MSSVPPAANQEADVGDTERHEIGHADLYPGCSSGVSGQDHVKLIDGEQDGTHDQRSSQGTPQVGSVKYASWTF